MGKCTFQDVWLDQNIHSDWVPWLRRIPGDKSKAMCSLCNSRIDISKMGASAIVSHAKGKKHLKSVQESKTFKPIALYSTTVSGNKESDSRTSALVAPVNLPENAAMPHNATAVEMPLTTFIVKEVIFAEIIWALNTVFCHSSCRESAASAELFPLMFPDSAIAKKFKMHKDKIAYTLTYGLGPYFQTQLAKVVRSCPFFTLSFDESLNKVSQRGQMDVVVRFWDITTEVAGVSTRYLDSSFLGHSSAEDLLHSFTSILKSHSLDPKRILQISLDGPNVNQKFLNDLKAFLRNDSCPEDPELLETGSCSLHIVNGAFKTAHKSCGWSVNEFLRALYNLFKDSPSRRADFMDASGSSLFPLKFCTVRWVENSAVIARAISLLPCLKKYLAAVSKKPPTSNSYGKVKHAIMSDPLLASKLGFMQSIALELEPYLTAYQSDFPLLPFMYEDLGMILRNLMSRFIKPQVLNGATSTSKLIAIDIVKQGNHLPLQAIDIGFSAKATCGKLKELDVLSFRKDCQTFLLSLCSKLIDKCPLSYKLVQGVSCLSPHVMKNVSLRKFRVTSALQVFVCKKIIAPGVADAIKRDYLSFCESSNTQKVLFKFDRNLDRLDHFLLKLLDSEKSSIALKTFVQQVMVLFHGNAAVERGFSVNKECLLVNQKEESLVAQRAVYSAVLAAGGVSSIHPNKSMFHAARCASKKRVEALTAKKAAQDELSCEKRLMGEIKQLEVKKRRIMEEASVLDEEASKLRQILNQKKKCLPRDS